MKRIVKIEYHRPDGNSVWVGGHIVGAPSYVKPAETIIREQWLPLFAIGGHFWADGDTLRTYAPGEPVPQ
jgi:hypothetical protein